MVDSVQVFDVGFRVTDADDNPVNNAKIKFREAGPGAPKTVYSDAGLSVGLGSTVRTRSDGQPVVSQGSETTTLVYVGSDPYHIEITDEDDAVIVPAKDNVKGAFTPSEAETFVPSMPVITTGLDLTLTAAHKGSLINATGNILTLSSAVTLGDGWWVKVRNNHPSSLVTLLAAQNISFQGGTFQRRVLLPGECMTVASDGTAFSTSDHIPPLFAPQGPGVVLIADRVSAEPVGPVGGQRFIVSSSFDTFTTGQIIEYNGAGWNAYTPPTDCGWLAYVQDEDIYYAFKGSAWAGLGKAALQIFTGSGTYTPTPGMTACLAISTGGGGGSGGADSDGTSIGGSAGGGAGATAIEMFSAADVAGGISVTIGAAGTAGANTGTNGGNGGDTTFGTLHTAGGGLGGTGIAGTDNQHVAPGGAGGTATGGGLNLAGGSGGIGVGAGNETGFGGLGGASFWGGGGAGGGVVVPGTSIGSVGVAYGSGGGGSANSDTAAGIAGAVGAGGVVFVLEFF